MRAAHTMTPMYNRRWFDPDDDPEVAGYLTDEERAFAAALAEATAPLVTPDLNDLLLPAVIARDFHPENELVARLGLSGWSLRPDELKEGLLDFGVHFSGNRVRGGRLHNQCYDLCGESPGPPLDTSGDIDALAQEAAQWFDAVLRRPVVVYVWLHRGYAYAIRYAFADTREIIAHRFSKERAPRDWMWAAIARGRVSVNPRWMQTHGLPRPDRYLHVRGEMREAEIPPGIRRAERRGSFSGIWQD